MSFEPHDLHEEWEKPCPFCEGGKRHPTFGFFEDVIEQVERSEGRNE
jgi:hypothetical protein